MRELDHKKFDAAQPDDTLVSVPPAEKPDTEETLFSVPPTAPSDKGLGPCEVCNGIYQKQQSKKNLFVLHTAQHNTTQHNTTQHNTTQHNTTQHNTTQHNTTQHNTTQHNTTQHNTTQHNTTTGDAFLGAASLLLSRRRHASPGRPDRTLRRRRIRVRRRNDRHLQRLTAAGVPALQQPAGPRRERLEKPLIPSRQERRRS